MLNRVTLIGNLGRDPECRRLENGTAVGKFSIATTESYKDTSGEWQNLTEWHDIVVWRKLAEDAEKYLKKGTGVYVEGKLTHRKYTDKNAIERYTTEIVASIIRPLESVKRDDSSFPTQEPPQRLFETPKQEAVNVNAAHSSEDFPTDEPKATGEDGLPF